jgi:hypothetical protein
MRKCHIAIAAAALAFALGGGRANAQQATAQQPQTYGYASPQAPYPSGQSGVACYPQRVGCQVFVCPNPCQSSSAGQAIQGQIPPIQPPPSCQAASAVIVQNELAPPVQNVVIYRNCYVPIQVQNVQPQVTAVNIEVRWREVHILCGADGRPLSSQQTAEVLKELNAQLAAKQGAPAPNAATPPAASPAATPVPAQAAAPAPSPTATPTATASAPSTAPTTAQAASPAKQWLWLAQYNAYGYGYQGDDGYLHIDQNSLRTTPPQL